LLQSLTPEARTQCESMRDDSAVLEAALQSHPGYGWAVLRTRYAEDALEMAVRHGVGQYVIVGAGFDSFALRRPAFARHVDIFEIDHPATQELKRQRLHECRVPVPPALHFTPADLSRETLSHALGRSVFRFTEPTFFSWLGVTQYLTREANLDTLQAIRSCSVAGSQLVFTYLDQAELAGGPAATRSGRLQVAFASAREPWVSGFDPSLLETELATAGFTLVEDLDGVAIKERYCPDRQDLLPMERSHIARAEAQ
jgi:methyltransferase (TIGR00027 family)